MTSATSGQIILLTAAEAAEILRTSPWRVTEACRAGELRASKPGQKWLIEPEAIREYLRANEKVPAKEAAPPRRRRRRAV